MIHLVAWTLQSLSYTGSCVPLVANVIFCSLAAKFWDLEVPKVSTEKETQSALYMRPSCTKNNKRVRQDKSVQQFMLSLFARLASRSAQSYLTWLSSSEHYFWHYPSNAKLISDMVLTVLIFSQMVQKLLTSVIASTREKKVLCIHSDVSYASS